MVSKAPSHPWKRRLFLPPGAKGAASRLKEMNEMNRPNLFTFSPIYRRS